MHRILSFSLAATLLACSSSGGSPPETTDEDSGSTTDDSSTTTDALEDSGSPSETGVGDSTVTDSTASESGGDATGDGSDAAADTSSPLCSEAGAIETQDCGKCGNKARLCGSDGMWLPFGACTGEKGVCVPGDTRMTSCGKCGTRTETCSATCGWTPGACTGEGVCNLGDSETQYGACTAAKEVKIRTCDATCKWSDFSACTAPKGWNDIALAPITGRYYHTAVWTGSEMVVWGGQSSGSSYAADGAAYDNSKDTWRTLASAPIVGRYGHTAVWTGSKMLVFGGYYGSLSPYYRNDGAAWDPTTNTWTTIAAPSGFTFAGRYYATAVWATTTKEMIVYGGYGSGCTSSYCADGAAYDPVAGTWRQIAAAPISGRYQHRAVWAGSKMIVYGGYGSCSGTYCADAASYDPSTNTWTTLTPPAEMDGRYNLVGVETGTSGGLATFWGGQGNYATLGGTYGNDRNSGATFDPVAGTWKSLALPTDTVITYSKRYNAFGWWGAGKLWIWGGTSYTGGTMATGMSYDPATDSWTAMPTTNAPTARYSGTVVWTGAEAIIWGGYSYKQDGKIYRP
ncbi:MAG: Kelch repeat-containing protein [Polyangiales bacterium]